jgi:hypothetical protein
MRIIASIIVLSDDLALRGLAVRQGLRRHFGRDFAMACFPRASDRGGIDRGAGA